MSVLACSIVQATSTGEIAASEITQFHLLNNIFSSCFNNREFADQQIPKLEMEKSKNTEVQKRYENRLRYFSLYSYRAHRTYHRECVLTERGRENVVLWQIGSSFRDRTFEQNLKQCDTLLS